MKIILAVLLVLFPYSAIASPILPNSKLTPGAVDPNATVKKLCTSGYTSTVRDVSLSLKKKVFQLYGLNPKADRYEVDHLISLELGGSNDIRNLWPQSITTQPYNAKKKNALENKLNDLICKKKITLKQAQDEIRMDWIKAYNKYIQK